MGRKSKPIKSIYGRLTVTSQPYWVRKNPHPERRVQCLCSCGKSIEVAVSSLHAGFTRSCGCLNRELAKNRATKHGLCGTPTYRIWRGMKRRCFDRKLKAFKNYGGRGIRVCERWMDYLKFLEDMGERPTNATLERKNNDGNYCPENCKWTTRFFQARNTRFNRVYTVNGITGCVTDLAVRFSIKPWTVFSRIYRGWDIVRALTQSVTPKKLSS